MAAVKQKQFLLGGTLFHQVDQPLQRAEHNREDQEAPSVRNEQPDDRAEHAPQRHLLAFPFLKDMDDRERPIERHEENERQSRIMAERHQLLGSVHIRSTWRWASQ